MIKLITICFVMIASSSVGHAKKGVNVRQVKVLDDTKFKTESKMGITCKKVQPPMTRKSKKSVILSSMTLMKMAQISISGELIFHFSCTRNRAADTGVFKVVDEIENAEKLFQGMKDYDATMTRPPSDGEAYASPAAVITMDDVSKEAHKGENSTGDVPPPDGEPSSPASEGEPSTTAAGGDASTAEGEPTSTPATDGSAAPEGSESSKTGGDEASKNSVESRSKGKKDKKKKGSKG